MHKSTPENSYGISPSSNKDYSFIDLIQEMKELGMDPKPILVTAANDIFSKYGPHVFVYAKTMLENMIKTNNPNGIYLWNELLEILSEQNPPASIRLN